MIKDEDNSIWIVTKVHDLCNIEIKTFKGGRGVLCMNPNCIFNDIYETKILKWYQKWRYFIGK